jgi:Fic family protein
MTTAHTHQQQISALQKEYEAAKKGKEDLLTLIAEAETPERVYNSNAIENSTLTLKETEKILLQMEIERGASVREVFEAKNLARVEEHIRNTALDQLLTSDVILKLHAMLITNIDDGIAGRFRAPGEYVRVGTHIAPAPEQIEQRLKDAFARIERGGFFVDTIARFHLDFEQTHPFNDGNGRVGRLLINYQLARRGVPPVIVRYKERDDYYRAFTDFNESQRTKMMPDVVACSVQVHHGCVCRVTPTGERQRMMQRRSPTFWCCHLSSSR